MNEVQKKQAEILHMGEHAYLRAFQLSFKNCTRQRLEVIPPPEAATFGPLSTVSNFVLFYFSCSRKMTPLCEIIESGPPEPPGRMRNEKQAEISTSLDQIKKRGGGGYDQVGLLPVPPAHMPPLSFPGVKLFPLHKSLRGYILTWIKLELIWWWVQLVWSWSWDTDWKIRCCHKYYSHILTSNLHTFFVNLSYV